MADADAAIREVVNNIAAQKHDKTEIKIHTTTSDGANYAYKLYEIVISAKNNSDLELFGKVAIIGEDVRSVVNVEIYEKEFFFYKHLVKEYKFLEEKYEITDENKLRVPICVGYNEEYLKETIVMENLLKQNFSNYDRLTSVNWDYASKCIKQLAILHSLSVVYGKENPKKFEEVANYLKFTYPKMFLEKAIGNAIAAAKDEYRERFSTFLEKIMENEAYEKFFKPFRLTVFAHGDFRPSNLMYRINENGIYEVAVVDFQTLQSGNPITDILYFIYNGSDKEFRQRYYHQLLGYYYTELSAAFCRFGLQPNDIYSKSDFEYDLKEVLPYGLLIITTTLPIVTIDVANIPKVEDDLGYLDSKTSPLFAERLNDIISDYIELGVL
ncbi:PREDICTED: uncharacterized protein LOC106102261 [Papilio polytes]|uniref:uncharacterized protein LOC106102261 n=1 Tax=Papilio polytes TaxID=76194 RepID=UPI000675D355|nr:PREDICTED: uncharacterized protein LOC106102261 [Papilio polytes]